MFRPAYVIIKKYLQVFEYFCETLYVYMYVRSERRWSLSYSYRIRIMDAWYIFVSSRVSRLWSRNRGTSCDDISIIRRHIEASTENKWSMERMEGKGRRREGRQERERRERINTNRKKKELKKEKKGGGKKNKRRRYGEKSFSHDIHEP